MPEATPSLSGDQRRMMILEAINTYRREQGHSPTVRELAAAVGLRSSSSVQAHIERLIADGKLSREPHLTRTLRQEASRAWQPDEDATNFVPSVRPPWLQPRGGHYARGCCFEVTNLETGKRFVEVVTGIEDV